MEKLPPLPADRTLARVIRKDENDAGTVSGEFSELLLSISYGIKVISQMVQTAGFKGLYGYTGDTNSTGDKTQKLDEESHSVLEQILGSSGCFGNMVSEERNTIISVGPQSSSGKYVVAFDPLDGSSNIGTNIPVGTIFIIFKRKDPKAPATEADFLQPASNIVCAGYSVYGAQTTLVYCTGGPVRGFTLDTSLGEFVLTEPSIRVPDKGSIYSVNEGLMNDWDEKTFSFVQSLKTADANKKTPYTGRYVGSLVADFDRTLKKGGIFMHPRSKKNPEGKLRLLYEAMPISYIAEKAGARSSNGEKSILTLIPSSIHQRSGFIVGSRVEMEWFNQMVEQR